MLSIWNIHNETKIINNSLLLVTKYFVIIKKKNLLTTPHHKAWAKLLNFLFTSFSIRYTKKDANIRPRNPMYNVVINSCNYTKKKEMKRNCVIIIFPYFFTTSEILYVDKEKKNLIWNSINEKKVLTKTNKPDVEVSLFI